MPGDGAHRRADRLGTFHPNKGSRLCPRSCLSHVPRAYGELSEPADEPADQRPHCAGHLAALGLLCAHHSRSPP